MGENTFLFVVICLTFSLLKDAVSMDVRKPEKYNFNFNNNNKKNIIKKIDYNPLTRDMTLGCLDIMVLDEEDVYPIYFQNKQANGWWLMKNPKKGKINLQNGEEMVIGCAGNKNYFRFYDTTSYKSFENLLVSHLIATCIQGSLVISGVKELEVPTNNKKLLFRLQCAKANKPRFHMIEKSKDLQSYVMFFEVFGPYVNPYRILFMDGMLDGKGNALYTHIIQVPEITKSFPGDVGFDWNDFDAIFNINSHDIRTIYGDFRHEMRLHLEKKDDIWTYGNQKIEEKSIFSCLENKNINQLIKNSATTLSRGHLTANFDFCYVFQRASTYYLNNAAPQWQITNGGNFKKLEIYVRSLVAGADRNFHVYSGTHGNMKALLNKEIWTVVDHKNIVRIPEVFWKIIYDATSQQGLVFVVFNSPCPPDSTLMKALKNSMYCSKMGAGRNNDYLGVTYTCRSIAAVKTIFDSELPNEIALLDHEVRESSSGIDFSNLNVVF